MNNLLTVTPNIGSTISAFAKVLWLYGLAFLTAAVGLYLYLPAPTGLGLLNMWVALPLIMIVTLLVMKLAAFGEMKGNISKQFEIFKNKPTWSMTALYLVTFGSFIGFSMALPLSITVIFGDTHVLDAATGTWVHAKNPNAPSGNGRDGPDGDLDGDGVINALDPDMDGHGIPNGQDPDVDGDGIANAQDKYPYGRDDGPDGNGGTGRPAGSGAVGDGRMAGSSGSQRGGTGQDGQGAEGGEPGSQGQQMGGAQQGQHPLRHDVN